MIYELNLERQDVAVGDKSRHSEQQNGIGREGACLENSQWFSLAGAQAR